MHLGCISSPETRAPLADFSRHGDLAAWMDRQPPAAAIESAARYFTELRYFFTPMSGLA